MTGTQFYIGIAIPSIMILLVWLHQNQRLSDFRADVNRQFDKVDGRLDRMDGRLDKMEVRLGRIDEDLRMFHGTDKELEGRLNELSQRIK